MGRAVAQYARNDDEQLNFFRMRIKRQEIPLACKKGADGHGQSAGPDPDDRQQGTGH